VYDLILRRAHVLDPGRGLDIVADLGIRDGRIAAVSEAIRSRGRECPADLAVPGRYVLPGLIDLHAHAECGMAAAAGGLPLIDPDLAGVRAGVTTVIDAGSVGTGRLRQAPGLPQRGRLGTTVLFFLNVASHAHEQPGSPDVRALRDIDRERIADAVGRSNGSVTGLKLRLVGPVVEEQGEELVDLAKAIANEHRLPLMVHVGQPYAPPESDAQRTDAVTVHLLRSLGAGDIVTHLCTPFAGGLGPLTPVMRAAALAARGRGVIFDVGVGRRQFSYEIARRQREAGFAPDTVSTDMTVALAESTSLVQVMSMLLAVGYSFADVVAMATASAAAALGLSYRLGAVSPGQPADLSIVDLVEGRFRHTDGTGASFDGDWGIRPVLTVKHGQLIEPGHGPHPQGWLPPAADAPPPPS
jgi:dihydroorotase